MGGGMNRFEVMIEKTYYIHRRYGVTATFALLYHEQPLTVAVLGSFIRLSDHVIPIDKHHDFIIFTFTSEANAYKASQNLLGRLDNHFSDRSSCIALDRSSSGRLIFSHSFSELHFPSWVYLCFFFLIFPF